MTDEKIIEEVIRLVGEGVCVTLPVNGNSMLPFIIGGRESVILQKPRDTKVGDVVLAWVQGGYYVVHRIIAADGDTLTLMGDGNLAITEQCAKDDIKALVTHVVDVNGRRHEIDNLWRHWAARLWWHLRPIRRYLLALYRRTNKSKLSNSKLSNSK
ncbi:MAG: S24/S26 family peptidase [Prevotella sp.]|nr:S24/S26 family peptidase [Prevotella sp.]